MSLHEFLHSNEPLQWQQLVEIAIGISRGLAFLHGMKILHRDLKSPNVLLANDMTPKLGDFGLSTIHKEKNISSEQGKQNKQRRVVGTPLWMPPELLSGKKKFHDEACDIYSLALVLWELTTREIPFKGISRDDLPQWLDQGNRPELPSNCPQWYADIIMQGWAQQPTKRMNAKTILACLVEGSKTESIPAPDKQLEDRQIDNKEANSFANNFFSQHSNNISNDSKGYDFDMNSYIQQTHKH